LADPGLPAIALLTGPSGRSRLLHEILAAGKDVMTTKPFETDAGAARRALEEARRLGRVLHLNSPAAVLPADLRLIREWEKQYDLGRPAYFYGSVHADYTEAADGSWYDDPARCPAPPIFRLGIYLINDVQTLWGAVDDVRLLETRLRTGRPTADNAVVALRMGNGAVGSIAASFCVRDGDHYRNSLQLSYERGTIYRNLGPERAEDRSKSQLTLVQECGGSRRVAAAASVRSDSHKYDWASFAEAIARRAAPDPEYIDRVVNGVEIVNRIAEEERRLPCFS
ncbi:MAG TPA: Gfo/Idh/MocA family oxidoreductase, partial [Candidatus Methylacidiphilales bacterium]